MSGEGAVPRKPLGARKDEALTIGEERMLPKLDRVLVQADESLVAEAASSLLGGS
jgi:hypothetical protein